MNERIFMSDRIPNRGKLVYVKAKKTKPHQGGHWSDAKKQEAVCLWVAGMSLSKVAVHLNVPYETVKEWKKKPWWDEIEKDIKSDDKQKIDAKLTKILDKSLDTIMDRLENGEYIYDQKTGRLKQTPAKLRDATVAFNTVMDKRQLLRKEPTKITEQTSSADQLKQLAEHFANFVTGIQKQEQLKDVVNEFIEGETVELQEDGSYQLKD